MTDGMIWVLVLFTIENNDEHAKSFKRVNRRCGETADIEIEADEHETKQTKRQKEGHAKTKQNKREQNEEMYEHER